MVNQTQIQKQRGKSRKEIVFLLTLPCKLPSQLWSNLTSPAPPLILLYGEVQTLLALRTQIDSLFLLPWATVIFSLS